MGLDAVELVIEVEEAFDVQISDAEAERICTVGQLYDWLIAAKAGELSARGKCLSATAFYQLRRGVCARLVRDRRSIRPHTNLESAVPRAERRQFWRDLEQDTRLTLPALTRPLWLVGLACAVCFAAAGSAGLFAGPIGFVVAFAPAAIVVEAVTRPWKIEFPPAFRNFRELSAHVLARNHTVLCQGHDGWSPSDVWDVLTSIIVEQLGVRPEQVTKDASFVSDLGMS